MRVVLPAPSGPTSPKSSPSATSKVKPSTARRSPKDFVSDSIITTKIKVKLAEEKLANAVQIKVDTDNKGVVTLSGTAKTQEEADMAVSIARSVQGVATVENNIQVAARK